MVALGIEICFQVVKIHPTELIMRGGLFEEADEAEGIHDALIMV